MKTNYIIVIIAVTSLLSVSILVAHADTINWYSLQTSNANFCYTSTDCVFTGEAIRSSSSQLDNKPINYVSVTMNRNGSPAGNFTVGVWSTSTPPTANNYLYRIAFNRTTDIATGGFQSYTFVNNTESYTLQSGQIVGIYYGSGTALNNLSTQRLQTSAPSPVDGEDSCWLWFGVVAAITDWQDGNCDDADMRITIGLTDGGVVEEGDTTADDCSNPNINCSDFCETAGNEGLLRCVVEANDNNLVIGTAGTNNIFNPISSTNEIVTGALGIENDDITTNGVGYLILVVALLIANVLWLVAVYQMKAKGVHVDSPLFVSALLSFGIIFAFVLAGWTDPLFLIVGIVAMIAFGAPKMARMIQGGGVSGGGGVD